MLAVMTAAFGCDPRRLVVPMDELLIPTEVSEITRLPPGTLRYMQHCGTGPRSFKLGRRVVYRRDDVDAWIATQYSACVGGGPNAG